MFIFQIIFYALDLQTLVCLEITEYEKNSSMEFINSFEKPIH